ncbi:MAG: fumarylacetoacetate hydrolase family protein, partial [Arenicellales bacterium]|nr:fumarylacetoacetate hydrolase family protein [Arenicellales bacterium]
MKLLRYGPKGAEKPGLLDANNQIRDLSSIIPDLTGDTVDPSTMARLSALDTDTLPPVEGTPRIGPCIGNVGKLVCIGLNYSDHAKETGSPIPSEPIVFMKATSSINGPDDDIELIRGSVKTDWEVELGFVIGRETKYVTEAQALDHVAGYCIVTDVSEREWQI